MCWAPAVLQFEQGGERVELDRPQVKRVVVGPRSVRRQDMARIFSRRWAVEGFGLVMGILSRRWDVVSVAWFSAPVAGQNFGVVPTGLTFLCIYGELPEGSPRSFEPVPFGHATRD